ncbi:recombinase family protein [Clostridium sp. C105KSO13]|uniref:recombinase family protein n=1 Tax=Clostridium sp. C105KSO13 TaxID=1776045 RepID=UPI0007406321|nr:recombinase family protein [Clostridium sp. C105KSO13]CUX25279.1 Putative transposon Tn552 DNA-invertase bin3 [Clostridium sp. C105KSO13]
MPVYGYHRTSTKEQHLDRGLLEISKFCEENQINLLDIFTDQLTGKKFDRPEYQFLKKRIQPGDVLIITELDRLGRNKRQILKELEYYRDRKVRVMILEIPTTLMDFSNWDNKLAALIMETINNLLIEVYAVFAETEIEKKEKRQREGIEAKKLRGEWDDYGRPHIMDKAAFAQAFERVVAGTLTPTALRKELGMSSATFYRYRTQYLKEHAEDFQSEQ